MDEILSSIKRIIADDDRSLEVHVCHSLTRELEVLRLVCILASPALTQIGRAHV